MPASAQLRAALADLLDVVADGVDARADPAAIRFELRLAGTACADAAAEPRQRVARADEPRQQVLQLRELHLQLAFARPRAAREDVEDQLRTVDHLSLEPLLELPQLRGAQLVVEDDEVHAGFVARRRKRRHLAGADERRGIRLGPLLLHSQDDTRAGRVGEAGELIERMIGIDAGRRHHETNEGGAETDDRARILQQWLDGGAVACRCDRPRWGAIGGGG